MQKPVPRTKSKSSATVFEARKNSVCFAVTMKPFEGTGHVLMLGSGGCGGCGGGSLGFLGGGLGRLTQPFPFRTQSLGLGGLSHGPARTAATSSNARQGRVTRARRDAGTARVAQVRRDAGASRALARRRDAVASRALARLLDARSRTAFPSGAS